jgi:hypothetical protein
VDALAGRGLSPRVADQLKALTVPIANGVQSFTRTQVGKIVQSQAFANAWEQANRAAHDQVVKALTGQGGGAVTVKNGTVTVNMAAFIQVVKQQLTAAGFTLAQRIPEVNASFVLFQSPDVTRAHAAFNLLNTLGDWLPVIVLLLLVIGVYVAKDHRRALVGAGLGVAAAMLALALGLVVFRSIYLNGIPPRGAPTRRRGGTVRHHHAVPARRAAHRAGPRVGGRRWRVPHRPLGHGRADPPEPGEGDWLGAWERRARGVA